MEKIVVPGIKAQPPHPPFTAVVWKSWIILPSVPTAMTSSMLLRLRLTTGVTSDTCGELSKTDQLPQPLLDAVDCAICSILLFRSMAKTSKRPSAFWVATGATREKIVAPGIKAQPPHPPFTAVVWKSWIILPSVPTAMTSSMLLRLRLTTGVTSDTCGELSRTDQLPQPLLDAVDCAICSILLFRSIAKTSKRPSAFFPTTGGTLAKVGVPGIKFQPPHPPFTAVDWKS